MHQGIKPVLPSLPNIVPVTAFCLVSETKWEVVRSAQSPGGGGGCCDTGFGIFASKPRVNSAVAEKFVFSKECRAIS